MTWSRPVDVHVVADPVGGGQLARTAPAPGWRPARTGSAPGRRGPPAALHAAADHRVDAQPAPQPVQHIGAAQRYRDDELQPGPARSRPGPRRAPAAGTARRPAGRSPPGPARLPGRRCTAPWCVSAACRASHSLWASCRARQTCNRPRSAVVAGRSRHCRLPPLSGRHRLGRRRPPDRCQGFRWLVAAMAAVPTSSATRQGRFLGDLCSTGSAQHPM